MAERAEHAALALRRAVTTGQDHDAAAAELLAAAAALATLRESANGESPSREPVSALQDAPPPDSVADTAAPPRPAAPEPHRPPTGPARRSGGRITKRVTKSAARRPTKRQRPPQSIDPGTVRLERSADYDISGTWRVVAGPVDDPVLVGFVRRNRPGKTWEAWTPALVTISGGPWRTRQDALVQLVLHHQQAAQPAEQT